LDVCGVTEPPLLLWEWEEWDCGCPIHAGIHLKRIVLTHVPSDIRNGVLAGLHGDHQVSSSDTFCIPLRRDFLNAKARQRANQSTSQRATRQSKRCRADDHQERPGGHQIETRDQKRAQAN